MLSVSLADAEIAGMERSSAGTRAATGRRRSARDHPFITRPSLRRRPMETTGTTPAPIEDAFPSAAWVALVGGGPVGQRRFVSGDGRSRSLALSESSESHERWCRATRDLVGPIAAGLVVVGRRPPGLLKPAVRPAERFEFSGASAQAAMLSVSLGDLEW